MRPRDFLGVGFMRLLGYGFGRTYIVTFDGLVGGL